MKTPNLDAMLDAYIACALWSSTGDDDEPLDAAHGPEHLTDRARYKMRYDCAVFIGEAAPFLTDEWTDDRIGHDLWLTRNGHGAGFWDRKLPNADQLSAIATSYGSQDLYVGDDGRLHL
jgi:hypothetical protein